MKKRLSVMVAAALSAGILTSCGTTAVVAVPQPTQEPVATQAPQTGTGESVKTGLSVVTSVASSKSATAEEAGQAQADVTLVAVTVSDDGVIESCVIDAIQGKVAFDATGAVTSDLSAAILSKNELGENYGMGKFSGIGKEWNEQAQALADYVEGKTLEQVQGIAITEDGKAGDADLSASVTIAVAGYLTAIESAVENATHLGAQSGDTLALTTVTSIGSSKSASAEEVGLAQVDANVAAVTLRGDVISSCTIDAVQAKVNFDATGTISTDVTAPQQSKNQLGDAYGMKKFSGIGKEWNEQAAGFCRYVTGKTVADVAGIAVTEEGKASDADLAASVTVSIGGFQALIAKLAG